MKNFPGNNLNKIPLIVEKDIKIQYILFGATIMFESGQDWKIAALKTSKRVHYFFYNK